MPQTETPPSVTVARRRLRYGIAGLAALGLLTVAQGLSSRIQHAERLKDWTEARAKPTVALIKPSPGGAAAALELPGRLEAHTQAPLFARVSGYLKSWKAEIGTPVKAGQVLAELETPDLDQQLVQARADLATAEADAAWAATTAARWQGLLPSHSVARQEVDEKTSLAAARQAVVKSARANVDRYLALKGFTRIVAPFDGVVTARNTDVGALVSVGSASGQELFVVSDVRKLRVYVSVPQTYAARIAPGSRASLKVPEHPDRSYVATVTAAAGAVDAASGTTLMQMSLDNASGELMPGGYANVRLELAQHSGTLSVPASTLIMDARGASLATVDGANRVVLKPVRIARDLGKQVEIDSGIGAEDRVIESPPEGLVSGEEVQIADPARVAVAGKSG